MEYELVEIASLQEDGVSYGFAIKRVGHDKLTGINILSYEEGSVHVNDMNERAELRRFWPMPTDPEVQALIDDPAFEPVEYDEVDVPDMDASKIVYDMKPGPPQIDPTTGLISGFAADEIKYDDEGRPIVNWMASEIVYKKERQPRRTQGKSRIEMASERVARERMTANA